MNFSIDWNALDMDALIPDTSCMIVEKDQHGSFRIHTDHSTVPWVTKALAENIFEQKILNFD